MFQTKVAEKNEHIVPVPMPFRNACGFQDN
jgi:hypothetical protein